MIKVAIVGDTDVGKSSLVSRFVNRQKEPNVDHTVGVDVTTTTLHFHDTVHHAKFFDLTGTYGYESLNNQYLINASAILVVFDVTKFKTFVRAQKLVDKIVHMHSVEYPIILVGNKMDKVAQRRVDISKALGYVKGKANTFFIETSAKHGANTKNCLMMLISEARRNKTYRLPVPRVEEQDESSGCILV